MVSGTREQWLHHHRSFAVYVMHPTKCDHKGPKDSSKIDVWGLSRRNCSMCYYEFWIWPTGNGMHSSCWDLLRKMPQTSVSLCMRRWWNELLSREAPSPLLQTLLGMPSFIFTHITCFYNYLHVGCSASATKPAHCQHRDSLRRLHRHQTVCTRKKSGEGCCCHWEKSWNLSGTTTCRLVIGQLHLTYTPPLEDLYNVL